MTDSDLLPIIRANAVAKARADAGDDSGCAAAISPTLPPVVAPIPGSSLIIWAIGRGLLKPITDGTTNADAGVASLCLGAKSYLDGGLSVLDLTNPAIAGTGGFLDGMTAAGIFAANTDTTGKSPTPGSKADLIAFGSVPQVIEAAQVSRIWARYRPNGQITGQPS